MEYKGMANLRKQLADKRTRVLTRYQYYDMKNGIKYMQTLIPSKFMWMAYCLGWCGKAVDSLADRLSFREFSNDNFNLNTIYRMNNMDIMPDSAMLSALISSCSFIYIYEDETGFPRMQVIDGANATGVIDPVTNMLHEGYAVLKRNKEGTPETEAYFVAGRTEFYRNGQHIRTDTNKAPYGIVNKIANAEAFDDVAWVLGEPVVNFSQSVVDNILKANVNFQGKAGMTPKIIRKAERKCCKWCQGLAGEYEYPMVPEDVYRRHERCRCQVDYDPGTGKVQNVHTKQWKTPEDYDKIEARKEFSASGNAVPAAPKDTAVADAIASGIVKDEINRDLQKPHCEPPKEGRSYLYGNVEKAEELYRKLRTTGTPLRDTKGNWTHKERVADDEPVGVWVDRNGNIQETKGAMIVYSKTGSHIYPRKEE